MLACHGTHPYAIFPQVQGHEFGGRVASLPDGYAGPSEVGDRVVVEPLHGCGKCFACERGKPNCCVDVTVMGVQVPGALVARRADALAGWVTHTFGLAEVPEAIEFAQAHPHLVEKSCGSPRCTATRGTCRRCVGPGGPGDRVQGRYHLRRGGDHGSGRQRGAGGWPDRGRHLLWEVDGVLLAVVPGNIGDAGTLARLLGYFGAAQVGNRT
jgi:hypothetical protein